MTLLNFQTITVENSIINVLKYQTINDRSHNSKKSKLAFLIYDSFKKKFFYHHSFDIKFFKIINIKTDYCDYDTLLPGMSVQDITTDLMLFKENKRYFCCLIEFTYDIGKYLKFQIEPKNLENETVEFAKNCCLQMCFLKESEYNKEEIKDKLLEYLYNKDPYKYLDFDTVFYKDLKKEEDIYFSAMPHSKKFDIEINKELLKESVDNLLKIEIED